MIKEFYLLRNYDIKSSLLICLFNDRFRQKFVLRGISENFVKLIKDNEEIKMNSSTALNDYTISSMSLKGISIVC